MKRYPLIFSYVNWNKNEIGKNIANYKIEGKGKYKFPFEGEIIAKADEFFLSPKQAPKEIFIRDDSIVLTFKSGMFKTICDYDARNSFVQWIINNSIQID